MLTSMIPAPRLQDAAARRSLRLGWLTTGRGPGSRALLAAAHRAITEGSLPATIDYVMCTRTRGETEGSDLFLTQAEGYGLPTFSLSARAYRRGGSEDVEWRERYNADLLAFIRSRPVDVLVFAGLLLIVGEDIINAAPALNLHPAAPGGPAGTWQDVIWTLIRQGASETGVTIQLATAEADQGPAVAFCRFPIRGPAFDELWREAQGHSVDALRRDHGEAFPLFARIREEGLRREALALVIALRQIADGHVAIQDRAVMSAPDAPLPEGVDITVEIEEALAARPQPPDS